MKKILTAIYNNGLQKQRFARSTHINRFLLKLSNILEQYQHGKHLGIYLLDFYIIDWSFYFHVVVNCFLYFLLIADMLQTRI